MKQRLQGVVAGVLVMFLFFGTVSVLAVSTRTIEVTYGVNIVVDGVPQHFAYDTRPFVSEGRTFLPVRGIADALGLDVSWDGTTSTVFINSSTPAIPAPTPTPIPTPTPTPAPLPTNLTQMDFFTASPVQGQNRWFEWSSTLQASTISNTGATWQDNAGNTYANGGILSRGQWAHFNPITGNGHSVTFLLNSRYTRFTGTIALSWVSRDNQHHYYIRIFGDDRELFTSQRITGGVLSIPFDVDVRGVTQLRIERLATGTAELGVMNPQLHR